MDQVTTTAGTFNYTAPTGTSAPAEGSIIVPGSEKPGANAAAGGMQPETERTFSQADVNRFLANERRAHAEKYADYDQLKDAAVKWEEYQAAQKSEAERTQELLTKLQQERDQALALANERLIRAAFIAAAARAGVQYPEDVYALADRAAVTIDKQGDVAGVDAAVEAIVKAGRVPLLAAAQKAAAVKLDGGAGAAARSVEKTAAATDEEVAIAARLGIPLEKYVARRKERDQALRT
jgi:hypothetical protein